jgi:hypothetical protein
MALSNRERVGRVLEALRGGLGPFVLREYRTLLDEFNRIEAIKGQTGKGKGGLTAVAGRRAAIAAALRECPAHAWIAVKGAQRARRGRHRG